MEIDFKELTRSPESGHLLIQQILSFAGISPCRESLNKIRNSLETPKQKSHRNDPINTFGIEIEELREDLGIYRHLISTFHNMV